MSTDWEEAWRLALYEPPGGFYLRPEGPKGHFRTASHAAPADLAGAVGRLARELGCRAVVDVGAGRGELLRALTTAPEGARLRLSGADVVQRPDDLPASIGWRAGLENLPGEWVSDALVIAWELLDVVPGPVLEIDEEGDLRRVEVEPATGRERLAGRAGSEDLGWARDWWPLDDPQEGDRVEIGLTRDRFWETTVAWATANGAGAALAVDYAHDRENRPPLGSLTGFRAGRAVPPRPDGSMDITTHVALDSVRAAADRFGPSELTTQAEALTALGVGRRELVDPGGLGGFGWLLQRLV